MKRKGQIIAIVGRPNVGKSALFNRILGKPLAIVEDTPGVTRDRHFGKADWQARSFWVVDTGGLDPDAEEGTRIEAGISRQAMAGIEQADQVVFVVDGQTGVAAQHDVAHHRTVAVAEHDLVAGGRQPGDLIHGRPGDLHLLAEGALLPGGDDGVPPQGDDAAPALSHSAPRPRTRRIAHQLPPG